MNDNRIDALSLTPSIPRQTPRNEFGAVLASSMGSAVREGAGLVSLAVPHPIISAAANNVSAMATRTANAGTSTMPLSAVGVGGASASPIPSYPMPGALPEVPGSANDDTYQQGQMLLAVQKAMQDESRQYNAVSNIMKVRHESAKAAVNNIR
jgi:hypothetical protein